ncbi:MAG TPA: alpha/beta fold hydrolase [Streptosporangiaceae bacterium]|nr:alpha/beta fold hydrolase [Streptosporangiaceae bacterium]
MSTATAAQGADHEERDITVRGTRIRMLTAGSPSGAPLLYLHGSGDLGTWQPALAELAQTHRVYRPDHPGFGASDDKDGIDSVHDLAFFYLDLLDEIEAPEAVVVGSSLGGWIAADLATIEPRRVSRLALVDACGVRADDVATPDMFVHSPVELAALIYNDRDLKAAAVRRARAMEHDPGLFERYLRNQIATAHLGWNPYLHDPKLPTRLHRIIAPTLIMWGAEDHLLPVGYARRWAELLPKAETAIIDDAGHLPLVERPAAALDILRTFLGTGARP